MHVHFSYQHVARNPQLDKTIASHVRKLEKFLSRFSPDLIQLHGTLEYSAAHQGPACSLNLWLPTARLHAREEGGTVLTGLQACFDHLTEQVKKHKQVLRREGLWKRRRYKFQQETREQEAGELRIHDRQQWREYLDQVLPQIERFIARELRYREMGEGGVAGQTQPEEIVDEVVARVLENAPATFADSVPFHRLVTEAIRVLNGALPMPGNAIATSGAEPETAGFPARKIGAAHLWRKGVAGSPDLEVGSGRPPDPVELLLASLPGPQRQVYVLHALEGFSWEEAARVLGQSPNEVADTYRQVSQKVATTLQESRVGPQS